MQIITLNKNHKTHLTELLNYYQLVTQDINLDEQYYVGIFTNNKLIAAGGLEFIHPYALLRSIAVAKKHTGNGYAEKICIHLSTHASKQGINELFLLTESAENYFFNHGFSLVERSQVPDEIKCSAQFSSLCSQRAAVMKKSTPSI